MKLFKKKGSFNILEMVPLVNYKHIVEENGLVSVLIPRFENKILVALFARRIHKPDIKVKLEKYGSAIWLLIDGNRTVKQIADVVNDTDEDINQFYKRISTYMNDIYLKKLINFKELTRKEG